MQVDFSSISPSQRYHLMTQTVVPRPIAWVLTDNGDEAGSLYNLAPFSYFNAVSSDPPLVMISVGHKPCGAYKDTGENLLQRKKAVIHIPRKGDLGAVNDSAEVLPHGESEIEKLGLATVSEDGWPLPRLKDIPVAMLCELHDHHEVGPNKQGVFYCEIKALYVSNDVATEDAKGRLKVDARGLNPLSRLGGGEYASFGEILVQQRPKSKS